MERSLEDFHDHLPKKSHTKRHPKTAGCTRHDILHAPHKQTTLHQCRLLPLWYKFRQLQTIQPHLILTRRSLLSHGRPQQKQTLTIYHFPHPFTTTATQLLSLVPQTRPFPDRWSQTETILLSSPLWLLQIILGFTPMLQAQMPLQTRMSLVPRLPCCSTLLPSCLLQKNAPPPPNTRLNLRPHHHWLPSSPIMISEPSPPPPPSQILGTLWWHIAAWVWIHLMTWYTINMPQCATTEAE